MTPAHHDKKAHGRAWGHPICGGMGHRAPTCNDFEPAATSSSSSHGPHNLGRRFARRRVGHFPFNPQIGHQASNQFADAAEFTHVSGSSIRGLDSHDAREIGLTDAQIAFAPGAKKHD